jgi:MFS family permease
MLYFLTYILISPLVAWLADRYAAGRELVAFGGFATLLAVLPLLISDSLWVSATAMVLFGLVQTLIGAPQLTLVFQVSEPRADGSRPDAVPTLGVFRLIERIGAAVGPLIAVILAITLSYREAIIAIGLLCSLSALLFLIAFPKAALPPPSLRPTETMP